MESVLKLCHPARVAFILKQQGGTRKDMMLRRRIARPRGASTAPANRDRPDADRPAPRRPSPQVTHLPKSGWPLPSPTGTIDIIETIELRRTHFRSGAKLSISSKSF